MKKAGWTLLWLTWLYPFLRIFVMLPIGMSENLMSDRVYDAVLAAAKYFHGGVVVDIFLSTGYLAYLAVSVVAYAVWHFRKNVRIGWMARIGLVFVIAFNVANVFLLEQIARDAQTDQIASEDDPADAPLAPRLGTAEEPSDSGAATKRLFMQK